MKRDQLEKELMDLYAASDDDVRDAILHDLLVRVSSSALWELITSKDYRLAIMAYKEAFR